MSINSAQTPSLVMRQGPNINSEYRLDQEVITIGRATDNNIVINDPEISRHHARISYQAGLYIVEDLDSSGGVYVNGIRIESQREGLESNSGTLTAGDKLGFGENIQFSFHLPEHHHLQALVEVGRTINSSLNIDDVLCTVMDTIIRLTGAERSFLMLKNNEGNLYLRTGRNWTQNTIDEADAALSRTIVHHVVSEGRAVLTNNAQEDPRFDNLESIMYFHLRSILCVPMMIKKNLVGVIYADNRINSSIFSEADGALLSAFADQAAIAIENATLFQQVQHTAEVITDAYDATIQGWSRALELRDYETEGHCQRVTELTMQLTQTLALPQEQWIHVRRGAILHDVGKMGISDSILLKPGKLTEEEWQIIRQHSEYGYELLKPIIFLKPALDIVRYHHERWDGEGYPKGLKGEEIPLAARIFSVADVWDALVHKRPYKKPWSTDEALSYIQSQTTGLFDAQVVEAFIDLIQKRSIQNPFF